jgi:phenylacetate-CoA ligase
LAERSGVRRVFPFGQTLTAQLLEMIQNGFGVRPHDLYGCQEAMWLGVECEAHAGLHIPETTAVVQIARTGRPDVPAGPGELGEVIVTSLNRMTTPFVRYRLGDVAAFTEEPCACGRETPRLCKLEGRVQDFLIAIGGRWVSPGAVATSVAYGRPHIRDHRIVQSAPDAVTVSLVAPEGLSEEEKVRITRALQEHLGRVTVTIQRVDEIPRDPSGKRRRVFRAFELGLPQGD